MRLQGGFRTGTPAARLAALSSSPELLGRVSQLRNVSGGHGAPVNAVFGPTTPMGRIPLDTTIRVHQESASGADLYVVAQRGTQQVQVTLMIRLEPAPDGTSGTDVTWTADMLIRGTLASVGQRVARDVATRAIGQVLAEAATVAGAAELTDAVP